jgi:hypothetical protein
MKWIVAVGAGAGLGLAYYGGLWLTVVGLVRQPSRATWIPVCGMGRLILLGMGLAIPGRQGIGSILAALGGLWLSRWYLLRRFGGVRHG